MYKIYYQNLKKLSINPLNIGKIFFFFFIAALFFQIHYVFLTKHSFSTGIFSDFLSFSLYLSDIFILLSFFFVFLSRGVDKYHVTKSLTTWFLIVLGIASITHLTNLRLFDWYFLLRVLLWVVAYETSKILLIERQFRKNIFCVAIFLLMSEFGFALYQFHMQHPAGLGLLGEQQVFTWNTGVAKLELYGSKFIRAYGTFPHPNVLGGIAAILLPLLAVQGARMRGVARVCFLLLLGFFSTLLIFLTFSRTAIFASFIGISAAMFLMERFQLASRKRVLASFLGTMAIFAVCALTLLPFLKTRATTEDSAIAERKIYNQVGVRLVKENPIFGTGAGESLLHMERLSPIKLRPDQVQPIHNYFLLAAVEFGLPASLLLLFVILQPPVLLLRKLVRKEGTAVTAALAGAIVCVLALMQFDHYLYTIVPAEMALWVLLGAATAEARLKPQED